MERALAIRIPDSELLFWVPYARLFYFSDPQFIHLQIKGVGVKELLLPL